MSTDIKPGQVRRWNNVPDKSIVIDSVDGVRVTYHQEDGASFTTNAIHLGYSTTLYGWDVTPADDATPAPLDPKSVHVGDTVTVRFKETGDVLTTKAYQPDDITRPGEWVYILGFPLHRPDGTFGLAFSYFEILAIEPAPEPVPEWEPGTVAEATVCGHPGHRVMRIDQDPDAPTGLLWADALGHRMAESVVTDVRPLVVIDPAAVDVDALVRAVEDSPQAQGWRYVVVSLLAELGIEKAS